jgi:peroxiredoxin
MPLRRWVTTRPLRYAYGVLLAFVICAPIGILPVRSAPVSMPASVVPRSVELSTPTVSVMPSVMGSTPPNFTLTDTDGTKRSLSDYRGRPVALCFFCGCDWCKRFAQLWGTYQRGGALAPASGPAPVTLVVFADEADGAKQFIQDTGLAEADTIMLPDMPDNLHVTTEVYNAEPCPRVFVIDPSGKLVYTNNHKDDQPRPPHNGRDEMVIASRALSALRQAEPKS